MDATPRSRRHLQSALNHASTNIDADEHPGRSFTLIEMVSISFLFYLLCKMYIFQLCVSEASLPVTVSLPQNPLIFRMLLIVI